MSLPDPVPVPKNRHRIPRPDRPVLALAIGGGGVCMLAVIAGLTLLGMHSEGTNDVAMTGLAAIGSTLAGGFASWIGRTHRNPPEHEEER